MKHLLALAVLLAAPAVAGAQEDERLNRILVRIEKEIRDSQARLRDEIRQLIRDELGGRPAAKPQPAPGPAPAPPAAPRRATLGITAGDLGEAERKAAGIGGGIKIEDVRGPAEQAGLKRGDILLEIDGEAVTEERIGEILGKRKPGDSVKVLVLRGKARETFTVVLGAR